MKKLRNSILLLLVFAMIISMIGCTTSGKPKEPTGEETVKKVSEKGEYPLTEEPITLNILISATDTVGELSENKATLAYQERTNVNIDWTRVSDVDFFTKLSLIFSSDTDLPDAVMCYGIPNNTLYLYAKQGLLQPMNDMIDDWGVYINKLFDYAPHVRGMITAPDGNIYGLPRYAETFHTTQPHKAFINSAWLNNLGLEVPETTDDLYEVLKSFKTGDPNGNKKADEIPLIGTNDNFAGSATGYLMNPFILNPDNNLFIQDGKVVAPFVEKEWAEGLKYMKKLYSEELLDQEFITIKPAQVKQLCESPDGNRLGVVIGGAVNQFADVNANTKEEFAAMAPLKGPNGLRQSPYFPPEPAISFVITKACKYPEIAFRWGDGTYETSFYTYDNAHQILEDWGSEEDVDWRKANDDEKNREGKPVAYVDLVPFGTPQNTNWGGTGPVFAGDDHNLMKTVYVPGKWVQRYVLTDATRDLYEPYRPSNASTLPPFYLDEEILIEYAQLQETIGSYVSRSVAMFITGLSDIDKDWDNYLKELEKMSLNSYIDIVQEAYDKQYAK